MTVVGSRYGKDNQYATGLGKGFTVICNDCGISLSPEDFEATFCVFCEEVAVIKCSGCKQEAHVHNNVICTRETTYVQKDDGTMEQLRDSKGGQRL